MKFVRSTSAVRHTNVIRHCRFAPRRLRARRRTRKHIASLHATFVLVMITTFGTACRAEERDSPRTAAGHAVARQALRFETVVSGLRVPWDIEFAPDGRMFVTERPGRVRVVTHGHLDPRPWLTLRVAKASFAEAGLMGMALDPSFAVTHKVYLCYSYYRTEQGLIGNRVVEYRDDNGYGVDRKVLVDAIPGALFHDGCRLAFGPDGNLYVTTGDGRLKNQARELKSLAGKILRLGSDGRVPHDNPFENSPVWSLGHRNPQGLAFQPGTGRLFETEHGSNGLNELNVIKRGGNYGWPEFNGDSNDPHFVAPILVNNSPPAGATFVTSHRYPGWDGSLLVAGLGLRQLVRVVLKGGHPPKVVATERLLTGKFGRLRDVAEGPNGYLYIATSNTDGRGTPGPDDDRIIRLVPN